ncbi:unnamed protein product [Acanthoscelides obtectus]|uniref:Uncharacterized protein n=1 Tax=Acanthoscelides obtectus TaxID=200917 RepID=A0A9P0KMR6_ACAOB|nr:unnamed protein product [Acanthoscelides obtectus]CAK1626179.1 hypothetical protein AOBTE_LOCUS3666 [Acanthoscelides obtectus]
MAEPGYVSICDLDFTDLTLYQHPPCMFTLWWLGIFVNAIWDPIKEAIEHILKSEGGGDEWQYRYTGFNTKIPDHSFPPVCRLYRSAR